MEPIKALVHGLTVKVTVLVVVMLVIVFGLLFFLNIRCEGGIRDEKYRETAHLLATSMMTCVAGSVPRLLLIAVPSAHPIRPKYLQ